MERIEAPYGAWEPASVAEVAALFSPLREPWWIAGGYAVELAVGRAFRDHADIDVLLLREDQLAAQRALAGMGVVGRRPARHPPAVGGGGRSCRPASTTSGAGRGPTPPGAS